ncbi:radical SAM protein [bacterium]|nr:radical SAM protein [bacterium]
MINRCYLEITNICNLSCDFCHKTNRSPMMMKMEDFLVILNKLKGNIKYLYFHLMGEPLLHENISDFISISKNFGFIPILTTNGTKISNSYAKLIESCPYKINISLHSLDSSNYSNINNYLDSIINFTKEIIKKGTIVNLRLWNLGYNNSRNSYIISYIIDSFKSDINKISSGYKISDKVYIDLDDKFDWPDLNHKSYQEKSFCHALRDQIGILVDGTVVPCCLDADGILNLGNIYKNDFNDIITSSKAKLIYDGFTNHTPKEELCKRCGYINETKKYHKK